MANLATSSQLPLSPEVTVVGGRPPALAEPSLKSKASFASHAGPNGIADLEQGHGPLPPKRSSSITSLKTYLNQDVDPNQATFALAAYCFMTGLVNAVTYSSVFVWAGFQTGNTVQVGIHYAVFSYIYWNAYGHNVLFFAVYLYILMMMHILCVYTHSLFILLLS
jgi:hypothetical protein